MSLSIYSKVALKTAASIEVHINCRKETLDPYNHRLMGLSFFYLLLANFLNVGNEEVDRQGQLCKKASGSVVSIKSQAIYS